MLKYLKIPTLVFRRGLIIAILLFTYRLTTWGMQYADKALLAGADLLGVAAILGAVAAMPLGILTLLFNKYDSLRKQENVDSTS
jgi:hypothetical protein